MYLYVREWHFGQGLLVLLTNAWDTASCPRLRSSNAAHVSVGGWASPCRKQKMAAEVSLSHLATSPLPRWAARSPDKRPNLRP